jgi:MinD-like ATPase involved in chromosome partitioning or flagellar assembly
MIKHLYSWVDVEARIERERALGRWPKGLVGASAYHDGLLLRVGVDADRPAAEHALDQWFGARFRADEGLFLEALPDQQRLFPVTIETTGEAQPPEAPFTPSFERVAFLPEEPRAIDWPTVFTPASPKMFAFYSFKGGVGRTLHLLAFLKVLSQREPRPSVLVIDADLEAPGLTSLAMASGFGQPEVSLVDFLAIAHGDTSPDCREAIALTVHHLKSQPLRFHAGDTLVEQYFLPAYREESQALHVDVRPEHLVFAPGGRWRLGEVFAALGRELEVDAVFLDLRAGLSELSSPLLFDPRMQRVIVTTPSKQSADGTNLVLRQLRKLAPPPERDDLLDPAILISFVTQEMAETKQLEDLREDLLRLYPDTPAFDEASPPRLQIEETRFSQELLVVSSLTDAMDRLDGTDLYRKAKALAEEWLPPRSEESPLPPAAAAEADKRSSLCAFAKSVEYAESGKGASFLATPQLRALAQKFKEEPPNVVVIGAKGSGKTYTYLQLVRGKAWRQFVQVTLGTSPKGASGHIWPFLQPKNLEDDAKALVKACLEKSREELGIESGLWSQTDAVDTIRQALAECSADESWWRRRWFELFARSLGLENPTGSDAADFMVNKLREREDRLVFVIDGLEEVFPEVTQDHGQQVALRALLQEVPTRIREIPNCPIGIVVFVRVDVVRAAIPQNVGQFERLYEPYALRWDREQALRLTVWICREAGIDLQFPNNKKAETISGDEATHILYAIWGRKLGTDNSKEARTAEWVIAALSDFRGQIQARDLVRLLRHAAETSQGTAASDRLLPPRSIRDALGPCSREKVSEIEQEIRDLKPIFDKLRGASERKMPFGAAEIGLERREVELLESTGIILESEGEYFMPEIFRSGLGFQLKQGARPRVLSLAKRALTVRGR